MNFVRFQKPAYRFYNNQLANDLYNELFNTDCQTNHGFSIKPAANVFETENEFKVEVLVPGYDKNEISIAVDKNQLVVKSEQNEKDGAKPEYKYAHVEFRKTSFEKRYQLSEKIDKEAIAAEFNNGILSITLPKTKEEKQELVRKIEIV